MSAWSDIDHRHMAQALRLAQRGLYTTQPNPRVGCVIAHGERIVGEGWHQRAGEAHAEVHALREAGEQARSATAYVTLEPCGKRGRTPPCADALIAAGVARIVIASDDPSQIGGDALERLAAAGITIERGLMDDAARELNRGFFSRIERRRPWVRVKLAMSLDGRTALKNGHSKWITGDAARAEVQRWRARSSAILTGSGTVLSDNPRLTARLADDELSLLGGSEPVPPLRVILDRELRTAADAFVLDGYSPTLLLHDERLSPGNEARFAHAELAGCVVADQRLDLHQSLRLLAERGCNEVQVEAGPILSGALFAAGLVDELLIYIAPILLGNDARGLLDLPALTTMSARWNLRVIDQRNVGPDIRLLMRVR
ncbi:MAG: bifunctional diaminohydroxyphosphoribosylaminopyrimidine deaminase/5-amino-6-(5-phosphoribosylamino)uracil reductase RibD [Dokdonella sp.]